jgi:hypothetical protein
MIHHNDSTSQRQREEEKREYFKIAKIFKRHKARTSSKTTWGSPGDQVPVVLSQH